MLRLRTLGPIGLHADDGEEIRGVLAQPKRIALLAYLALARGWQRRDALVALFWPELDSEHARNSLNQALFFLRRHLGAEAIQTRNSEEIALSPEMFWCDAVAFEEAAVAGRYAEAVDLYRGELLASFHVPEAAAELERWIDRERHRLARLFAGALEALAESREQAGDFGAAAVWWRRLAVHDPHDGRVALRTMRALAAAGDRAGALEHARIYTLLLREELEAEPEPEVTALAERLRAGAKSHTEQKKVQPTVAPVNEPPARTVAEPRDGRRTERPRPLWRRYPTGARVAIALAVLGLVTFVYRARTDRADPTIRTIAVLPFENLTNDPSKEYLADVFTDALITEVARYPDLQVRSRLSVLQFKGAKRSAAEVAQALHVDAFVEGTLTTDSRSMQVEAQLIKAPDDRHLWSERYVRDSANLLAIESDIAAAIAREVNARTAPIAEQPRHVPNGVSYDLYLRGQTAMLNRTPRAMHDARVYFHQAIARDSTFALGYAGLSEAILVSGLDGFMDLRVARDSALISAQRAIALDSTLPQAHTALAAVYGDGAKWVEAEKEYRQAIHLGSSDALPYHWLALQLYVQDRLKEAYETVKKGREIDPTSASLARTAGAIEHALGISKPSSQYSAQAVLIDPLHAWSRATYARRLAVERKCVEARAHIDTARSIIPDTNIRMGVQVWEVEWRCGNRERAAQMLAALKRRPDARSRGLWIASVYKTMNQPDSAFAWLDSVEWNGDLRFNFRGALWNTSRSDPRYKKVLKQMGLDTALSAK